MSPSNYNCVSFAQIVCVRIPASAAEVVERIVQPRTSGSRVHGADADGSVSCSVGLISPVEPGL